MARALTESLGEEHVTSHHGSLSRERRLAAEQRLKAGELKALVATASLELGIDIGDVDLVCQLGSTRSISTFLQRAGRSGHAVHGTPKGRLFPLTRDELVEYAAILDAVRRGELDTLHVPVHPLDVLAQQVVAMVAAEDWSEDALLAAVRRAWPYRNLDRERWRQLLAMLAGGFATRRGRRSAYLHRDVVNGELRARRGARLTAMTSGGAIPDNTDYDVVLEPHGTRLGSVNEDFAIESLPGDIFQLGNTSWRILRIERSSVRVEDAHGQPPNLPFWLGEAPGRTGELSDSVCDLLGWLDAPMFDVRWRWNANVSLAIPRFRGGAKVPPNIQRMQAEDLVAAVFPDQIACAENLAGPRAIPDHPLVEQTIADALTEAMDIDGLETLVRRLGDGDLQVVARDLTEPSPLAAEVLDARPYAFLDDEALAAVVAELKGFAAPAAAWESEILPARIVGFTPDMLDRLCLAGWASWARPAPPVRETPGRSFGPIRSTPIALF